MSPNVRVRMFRYLWMALAATTAVIAGASTGHAISKPFLTCGIFIGKIEEGARVFTPTRFLPFNHPEALGHQFPTALELHQSEYDILVFIGEKVGLKLQTTLERYPMQPITAWKYPDFEVPPVEDVRRADTLSFDAETSPIPGLQVVAYKDRFPLSFIVDTRRLTLTERGMERATAMGLDLTRAQFLDGLTNVGSRIPAHGTWIVIFRSKSK
jgi:hypothetical protein